MPNKGKRTFASLVDTLDEYELDLLREVLAQSSLSSEELKELLKRPQVFEVMLDTMRDTMDESQPCKTYHVTIQSVVQPSYAELRLSYDWINNLWDEELYERHLHECLEEVAPQNGEIEVLIKHFGVPIVSDEALKWASESNCRAPFPWEREALTVARPYLQRRFNIVDLGSHIIFEGKRIVPISSCGRNGSRALASGRYETVWDSQMRFLFVRKQV